MADKCISQNVKEYFLNSIRCDASPNLLAGLSADNMRMSSLCNTAQFYSNIDKDFLPKAQVIVLFNKSALFLVTLVNMAAQRTL